MEQKGSLPPIIEDESDDNSLSMLYKKELSRQEMRDVGSRTDQTGGPSSISNTSDVISETPLPYNTWKSKHYLKSTSPNGSGVNEMQSKLGQSLDSCQGVVPSHAGRPYQYQRQDPTDASYGEQKRLESNFNQQEKYSAQHLNESKAFHFSFNDTPKGYFPEYSRPRYLGAESNSPSHFREYATPSAVDRISYHHTPMTPCSAMNASQNYFGHTSHNSYKDGFISRNLESVVHNRAPEMLKPCQKSCCTVPQSMHTPHNIDHSHSPYSRNNYHLDYNRANIKVSPESRSCNCHRQSEIRDKKRDKLEKVTKKQICDLYRIVWLQNEQILQLQKQIKRLVQLASEKGDERSKKSQETEQTPKITHKEEKRMFNLSVIEENQNLLEKVSVGIMTSFIDTTTVKKKGKTNPKDILNAKTVPKSSSSSSGTADSSQSSSSSEDEVAPSSKKHTEAFKKKNRRRRLEDSNMLSGLEINTVAENHPSPASSPLQIEMQDFDSSTTDSSDHSASLLESDGNEDSNQAPVGWTFYDKVVGKVNNMLSKSDEDSEQEIKRKTVDQLRKLGISMGDHESPSKRVTFDSNFHKKAPHLNDSDTSLRMNALAVKYLNEENSPDEPVLRAVERQPNNMAGHTNLSYATLRYLERYHLLPKQQSPERQEKVKKSKKKKDKQKKEDKYEEKVLSKKKSKHGLGSGKILDITAIKQQPKLLPKKH